MTRRAEIEKILPSLLKKLYGIQDPTITSIPGGRLSDTFKIQTTQGSFFLKIPHNPTPNFSLSTDVATQGVDLGLPFSQPYAGIDKKLCQTIPEHLESTSIPECLRGFPLTLVEFYEPPQPETDTAADNNPLRCYAMGAHLGSYSKFNDFIAKNKEKLSTDPLSATAIQALIYDAFSLTGSPAPDDMRVRYLSLNLTLTPKLMGKQDPVAQAFGDSLQKGTLSGLLTRLNTLIKKENEVSQGLPHGLINNDIKYNNFFFTPDQQDIALAFDLDMVTYGPLVKDLGRAIALNCFDTKTGQFQPHYAQALIHGRHSTNPLTPDEMAALPYYIELGIIASYALRSSYFKEELQGQERSHDFQRLDPAIHLAELESFDSWHKHNHLSDLLSLPKDTSYPATPQIPTHTLLGPGPLPSWKMGEEEKSTYWKENTQPGHHGFGSFGATDGILHRDQGIRSQGHTGVGGLIDETVKLLKDVSGIPKSSKVVFLEGGHHAVNVGQCNLFATEPHIPVVVIGGGGFANLWAHNLKTEFEKKGLLNKVISISVPDGESVTLLDVQDALAKEGISEGQLFNIMFASSETSTSVMIPKQTMIDILNIPGRNRALIDASSGAMVHDIPGTTEKSLKEHEVKRGVSYFATGQKGFRFPSDLTILVLCADDTDITNADRWERARVPMPKDIATAAGELDGKELKRSTRAGALLEAHHALSHMQALQKQGIDLIKLAERRSQQVQQAISMHPDFDFFVPNPANRGQYNVVVTSTLAELKALPPQQRQAVIDEAHEILADEGLIRNIKPYQGRGDYRFTTLDIESEEEAQRVLDAISYATKKAYLKLTHKTFDLIAEDQFLYSTPEAVEGAILRKKEELAKQGIQFIDARNGLPLGVDPLMVTEGNQAFLEKRYYTSLPMGRYVVYRPGLQGKEITQEFEKISAATLQPSSLIVAAKTVPPEARFDIFVRQGAGTNNIPKQQAEQDGHVVVNCPGINSKVTSNNTLNALAGHPHIQHFVNMAMEDRASSSDLKPLYGPSPEIDTVQLNAKVRGKTIAVLGAGDIGTQTILSLLASEAKEVRVYSRNLKEAGFDPSIIKQTYPKLVLCASPQEAMTGAHIAINHLPLTEETKGVVDQHCITAMLGNGEIVDASRPGIIDPDALINALTSSKLHRVVVDFDTPEKAVNDGAIANLFSCAKEYPDKLLYSPHAFADTCPNVREQMFKEALLRTTEIRSGTLHNFAGLGTPPTYLQNCGNKKPEGITHLKDLLSQLQEPVPTLTTEVRASHQAVVCHTLC